MIVDTIRTNDSIRNSIGRISRNMIDIACVQDTHNERTYIIIIKGYDLFFWRTTSRNNKQSNKDHPRKAAGVAAIAIRRSVVNDIRKIIRINGGIMGIRLHARRKNKTL